MSKIYAVTKYTKHQLANINGLDLAHSVQLHTDKMLDSCRSAAKAVREATEETRTTAIARLDEANERFDAYIEEQRALFAEKKMNPDLAYKNAIVPTDAVTKSGETIFRIITREKPITPFNDDADSVLAADERAQREAADVAMSIDVDDDDAFDMAEARYNGTI